jgi:hypothetical protein
MSDDISAIIAGLSAAQRELLGVIPCYAVKSYPPARTLVARGLADWSDTGWCIPTAKGLAVRNALIERAAK